MKRNLKQIAGVALFLIAGILFITTALQNGDIPYVIVGVGMILLGLYFGFTINKGDKE